MVWRNNLVLWLLPPVLACGGPPGYTLVPPAEQVSADSVETTVILIGDAGTALLGDPVLRAATQVAARDPENTMVVFLGDLVYPAGLPPRGASDRMASEQAVYAQTNVVAASGAYGIIMPGNHDWAGRSPDGLERIMRVQTFVEALAIDRLSFLPRDGCPGPVAVDFGNRIRLIGLDAHWWLQDEPQLVPEHCPAGFPGSVLDSLRSLLGGAGTRDVVYLSHHPLDSYGPHGGYFTVGDHLFPLRRVARWLWVPLPVVGSAYPIYRRSGALSQDLSSKRYRSYRDDVGDVLAPYRPLAAVGGHEHSLQVLRGDVVRYNIVSGAGAIGHQTPAGWKDATLFAASEAGFVVIEFVTGDRVRLSVITVGEDGEVEEGFSAWMDREASR